MRQVQGTRRMLYLAEMLEVLSTHYTIGLHEIKVLMYWGVMSTTYVATKTEIGQKLKMDYRNICKAFGRLEEKKILYRDGRKKRFGEGRRAAANYEFTTEFMSKVLQAKGGTHHDDRPFEEILDDLNKTEETGG